MKKIFTSLVLLLCFSVALFADDKVFEKLKQIPQVRDLEVMMYQPFTKYYIFNFEQPLDHQDPSKGTFKQRVLLGHKEVDRPVVVELEGYGIVTWAPNELTTLFECNQLTIEHRFFKKSVPEGEIPWDCLTLKQSANDQHDIIQALKKALYTDSKWISTGVSKGGQTAVFHRYFYPEDVDITVPYVAPFNLKYVDPRLEKFLNNLGKGRGSFDTMFAGEDVDASHWGVRDFQLLCFQHQKELSAKLAKLAEREEYTFNKVGGVERALQLMILEYPFAFWQWGHSLADIPTLEYADMNKIFKHLLSVSGPGFFEDKDIRSSYAFFYAALTETGMYDYNIKPFKKYMPNEKSNRIDFSFAIPENAPRKAFDEKQMKAICHWLQTDAEKILFVYGGSDPWYATGIDLKSNSKCRKYVRGDGCHTCRIKDFDPVSKEDLLETLNSWLEE